LRSYDDTQANYVFIVNNTDDTTWTYGKQMGVLSVNVEREVLGWSRFTTDGTFLSATVCATDHGDGFNKDTLYVLVERDNAVTLEALTEEDIYLDCYFTGTDSAKTTWTSTEADVLDTLTVQIVADGAVQNSDTVADQGGGAYGVVLGRTALEVSFGLGRVCLHIHVLHDP